MLSIRRRRLFTALLVGLLALATLALLELTASVLLNQGGALRGGLLSAFRSYYMANDRSIIQYRDDCAQYDPALAYILRPGSCRVQNREYDVEYRINRLGLRDDEQSLAAPEVIVLGDSHAMGWGVAQEQVFSSLLEQAIQRPVLNAAISSYGTVRELRLLERLNLTGLRYLVIQYCDNDFGENSKFRDAGGKLSIMSRKKYLGLVEEHRDDAHYFFGKHSYYMLAGLVRRLSNKFGRQSGDERPRPKVADEAAAFLFALRHARVDLTGVEVIVLQINGNGHNDKAFIDELRAQAAAGGAPLPVRRLLTLDLSSLLVADDYFLLDDHMNSRGHQAVAAALIPLIGY